MTRIRYFVIAAAAIVLAGCASNASESGPSDEYQAHTEKTPTVRCAAGYVLTCESKRTGRIRFGRLGNKHLQSCACEEDRGMPVQSPLPGIY